MLNAPVIIGNESTTHEKRFQIDHIDATIAGLLKERASISHDIQRDRVRSGGARVDLGRERDVISAYVGLLGTRGTEVANTVLTYCRGEISDAVRNEREGQAVPANGVAG